MSKKMQKKESDNQISFNKTAKFNFFITEKVEAGIQLQGWEIKSLRCKSKNISLSESYVFIKNGEAFISNMSIQTLETTCKQSMAEPNRVRKLLLHKHEIKKLSSLIDQKGMTLVAMKLYWSGSFVKAELGLAKGKNTKDKRDTIKDREWSISQNRTFKNLR